MTPEQLAALTGARGGDLILIATPSPTTPPPSPDLAEPYKLLLIDSVRTIGMLTRRAIYLRSPTSLLPEDWLAYRQNPTCFWRNFHLGEPATSLESHIIAPTSQILLRPTFDDLHHSIFYGTCPWLYCSDGLVDVNHDTGMVLGGFAEVSSGGGGRRRALCPFCMGAADTRGLTVDPMAYSPSTREIPRLALPPAMMAPIQAAGSVTPNLRPREWYVKATSRVLSEGCPICLEKIQPGAIVADLPCWHFFHADCWARVVGGTCPFRCNEGMIPNLRALNGEAEVEDVEEVEEID